MESRSLTPGNGALPYPARRGDRVRQRIDGLSSLIRRKTDRMRRGERDIIETIRQLGLCRRVVSEPQPGHAH